MKFKVKTCNDCPFLRDNMRDSYCGILMRGTVEDDIFTIEQPWEDPPKRCPLRAESIKVKLA